MGVQVINVTFDRGHRLLHAAQCAFAARRNHVVAIGSSAVTDDFRIDLGAALERMLQLFNHHHAAAAGYDETVTLGVVSPRGLFRRRVVLAGQGAHGVEQAALAPVFFLAAAGKDDILLAHLNLLHRMADAMRTGRAGRGNGVVDALDPERRCQAGGNRAAHGARYAVWADALDALFAKDVDGFHLIDGGSAAGAGDQADAWIGDIIGAEPRIFESLLHRQIGVSRRIAHEAQNLAVDQLFEVQVDRAGDLATQPHIGIGLIEANTGAAGPQVGGNGVFVIAEA